MHGYGVKFYNEYVNDMTKIVKALEYSDVLMKGVTETYKNYIKKGGTLPLIPMLLGTLGVSLLSGRGLYRAGSGKGLYRAGEGKGLLTAGEPIKKNH